MQYSDLINKVQQYSGFSIDESRDALDCTVESIAVHLNEHERKDFASSLPEKLQDMALSVYPSDENVKKDIVLQVMELNHVSKADAYRQLQASWHALKELFTSENAESLNPFLAIKIEALLP